MNYDRGELKRSVKCLIRQTRPSPLLVTLVFLLVSSLIPTVAEWFIRPAAALEQYFSGLPAMIESGDEGMIMAYMTNIPGQIMGVGMLISIFLSLFSIVMEFGYKGYCLKMVRLEEPSFGDIFTGFAHAGRVILMNILIGVFLFLWTMLFVTVGGIVIGLVAAFAGYETVPLLFAVLFAAIAVLEVVLSLRYSMAVFVLLDNPGVGPLEPIRRSKEMMKGRKGELFVLALSFIGWYALIWLVLMVVAALCFVITNADGLLALVTDPGTALLSVLGSMGVTGVVCALVSILLSLWIQPYVTGSTAQFYQMISGIVAPGTEGGIGGVGNPPYGGGGQWTDSGYGSDPQTPSTPGYDPEKNAPQKPDPGHESGGGDARE